MYLYEYQEVPEEIWKTIIDNKSIKWIAIVKLTKWIKMNIIVLINIQRTKLWKL